MRNFLAKSLNWWLEDPDFDNTAWWMKSGSEIDNEHKMLTAGKRHNGSSIYRPGPFYWELLRRHPDLPKLKKAARGNAAANLRPKNLFARLGCLDETVRGCAFYLIGLHNNTWMNLPGDVPQRFEHLLPKFLRAVSGDNPSVVRFPIAAVDLLNESSDQLGVACSISSFLVNVDPVVLNDEYTPEKAIEAGHKKRVTERVLRIDRLEHELKRLDLELGIYAFHESSNNASIIEIMNTLLSRFRPRPQDQAARPGRLQPDVLRHLHEASKNGEYSVTGLKKVRKYLNEISFDEMTKSLRQFDREQKDIFCPDT